VANSGSDGIIFFGSATVRRSIFDRAISIGPKGFRVEGSEAERGASVLARISHHCLATTADPHRLAGRLCPAQILLREKPSAAIRGRPLGGPVVHRTTGSSASPFKPARRNVRYAFAVSQPVRPARPAPRRPRDGSGEKSELVRPAVRGL
jgi:hypothetical protein